MFNYVTIKHKHMSFVSNGGKFKLYTVLNGLLFPTPTQPRISFERMIFRIIVCIEFRINTHCGKLFNTLKVIKKKTKQSRRYKLIGNVVAEFCVNKHTISSMHGRRQFVVDNLWSQTLLYNRLYLIQV
jgi:hypothetical protein